MGRCSPPRCSASTSASALGRRGDYLPGQSGDPFHDQFALMTHDQVRYDRHLAQIRACPDLAIAGATWGWMGAALGAMAQVNRPSTATSIAVPLVILAGTEDRVVVNTPAQAFAARAPQGRYVEVPGSRHEIMMEVDAVRTVFWSEFDALQAKVSSPNA
jgi:lysophospholipase